MLSLHLLRRTGLIASSTTTFLYYPAISPDRRTTNAATGANVVVAYNVLRQSPAIFPRIVAGSSITGAWIRSSRAPTIASAFGFSKSSTPSTAADWCKYFINYGSLFPDYPKLGDAAFSIMIGVDVYHGNPFLRADVLTIAKPAGGGATRGRLRRLNPG